MRRSPHALPLALAAALAGGSGLAPGQDEDDPFGTLFGEEQGLELSDDLPEDPVERAVAFVKGGRHDEAEALLQAARDDDPEDLLVLRTLGRLYLKTGRDQAAADIAAELQDVAIDQPWGHLFAGILAEGRGELAAAEEAYRNAWTLSRRMTDPVHPEALLRLGELLGDTKADGGEEAGKTLERVLRYYQETDQLVAEEFVWVARACRSLERYPAIEDGYRKHMAEYARQMLDQAFLADGRCVAAHVAAGALALEKYDTPGANDAFEKAVELDPNHPEARVGLARARLAAFYAGRGRYEEAAEQLQAALAVNPSYAPAHATLASIALTDGEYDDALERLENALESRPGDVSLRAVKAAVHMMRGEEAAFAAEEAAVLEARPRCARFYVEVAELVQLKFRYAEARDLAQEALEVDPGYDPALAILGVNLTRTGDEEDGIRILKQAFEEDPFNVYTYNQLELFDRLDEHYETIESEHFVVRMHKEEVQASSRYVLALLEEAHDRLGAKYGELPEKVLVELFPDHNDFSARSVGLPGIPALGVCFGNVVTVLSAEERDSVGAHSWGRTLWHEFAHVATLTRTKNRIPRWFTEGLSVFEEPRGRPSWQREYDAEIMTLMARGLLLPIAELDAGFTKPRYGGQVIMSYYQGGMTCEFINARWGFGEVRALLDSFRKGHDTAAAIRDVFDMEPAEFDDLFHAFLRRHYSQYAFCPRPGREERNALLDRVGRHPWDVAARGALARAYALTGSPADAERHAGTALAQAEAAAADWALLAGGAQAYPGGADLVAARAAAVRAGAADAHFALGIVAQRRGRAGGAIRHLDRALELGTRDPATAHSVLGSIRRAQGDLRPAIRHFERAADLLPPNADIRRVLQGCWSQLGDQARAMAELREVCLLDSEDTSARVTYAQWARDQGRWDEVAFILDDINLIDPFIGEAHVLLADALRRTAEGDPAKLERAVEEYQAALDLEVSYRAGCWFGQAWCLHELGRDAEALPLAEKAAEDDPDLTEAVELRDALREALGAEGR